MTMTYVALLRLPAVVARTGLSRSAIYRLGQLGQFPRPVSIGPRASAWPSDEVDVWIASRIAASRGPPKSREAI
jgi:prophage regulatory protein